MQIEKHRETYFLLNLLCYLLKFEFMIYDLLVGLGELHCC